MKKDETNDLENKEMTKTTQNEEIVEGNVQENGKEKKDHTGGLIIIVLLLIAFILALLLLIKHPISFHTVHPAKPNDVVEPIAQKNIIYHSMQFAAFNQDQSEYKDNKVTEGKNTLKTPEELGLAPTSDQYTFAGWTTDVYLPTAPVQQEKVDKSKFIDHVDVADKDVHVYAVWAYRESPAIVDENTCVLTFHMNSVPADLYPTKTKTLNKGEPYTITYMPESIVDGVAGIGWSKQPYPLIPTLGTIPEEITQVSIKEDTTLYAIWGEDNNFDNIADCKELVNVKYVSKEEDITYKEGKYIYYYGNFDGVKVPRLFVEYITPEREGYQFAGWEFDGIDPKTNKETTILCQSGEEIPLVNVEQFQKGTLELRAKWTSGKEVVNTTDSKPVPPTGDQSNRSGYVLILVISAAFLIFLGIRQYKNKK